jgi:hypothetical protein
MDEKYKIYCKKISDDLKNASRDNPKHFWKILGGHKRKQQRFLIVLFNLYRLLEFRYFCLANLQSWSNQGF